LTVFTHHQIVLKGHQHEFNTSVLVLFFGALWFVAQSVIRISLTNTGCAFDVGKIYMRLVEIEARKPEAPAVKEPKSTIPKEPIKPRRELTKKNWEPVVSRIVAGIVGVIILLVIIEAIPYLMKIIEPRSPYKPPLTTITENNGYYIVHHEWNYGGGRWQYDAEIPKETYQYFRNKPRVAYYSEYVDNPADDNWMNRLGSQFENLAEKQGWGDFDTVSFALSFVQSLPYTSDVVTTSYDEYPRYPVETIVDGGGDCEDTSVLFSSIVRGMGYGTVLLKLEEDKHMAVGVLISQNIVNNWNQNYSLTYYTSNGKIYAYCETTGEGWELGHKPEDLKSTTATIISV